MASLAELAPRNFELNPPQNRFYEIDGNRIKVTSREFLPPEEHPKNEVVIFLPGRWVTENTEESARIFAFHSRRKTLLVTTRPEKVVPNSLHQEARAIKQMIVDSKLRRLTIAGYSEGGTKAANLVHTLQEENPEIQIYGLILFNPVGIHGQKKTELVGKYTWGLIKAFIRNPKRAIGNVMSNIGQEATESPRRHLRRIKELATANPSYKEVKCPVVLMQGRQDLISSPAKVTPENVLPNSPHVKKVALNGDHHAIVHMRLEQAIKVSLRLLDRHWSKSSPNSL